MPKLNLDNTPNAKMIKTVQEKSVMLANAKTVQDIPLDLIDENEDNSKVFNMNDIERLAENIRQEGFFGTIEVYQKENGRYEISSGHRRFKAMQLNGAATIPATVSPMPEYDTKKRRKLIASNINSRNMSPLDWARAIQYYLDTLAMEDAQKNGRTISSEKRYRSEPGHNRLNEASEYFGFNVVTLTRYIKLNELIPELQKMIEEEMLPWTSIWPAGTMPKEYQSRIYEDLTKMYGNAPTFITLDKEGKEEEVAKKTLTGTQVAQVIEKYKNIEKTLKEEKTSQKKDSPSNSSKSVQKENQTVSLDEMNDENLGLPVYKEPQEISHIAESFQSSSYIFPIDKLVLNFSRELNMHIKNDFSIEDKQTVKDNLQILKECISTIESKL